MIHCDLCEWTHKPRIRNSKGRLEECKGRVRLWYAEHAVSLIIEDGNGEDNPLVEVEVSIEFLKGIIAVAEIDMYRPDPYAREACCGNSIQAPQV